MLNGIAGHIVEVDVEGRNDWTFCAFFVFEDDALDFARERADEPTRYRVRPQQPAIRMAA